LTLSDRSTFTCSSYVHGTVTCCSASATRGHYHALRGRTTSTVEARKLYLHRALKALPHGTLLVLPGGEERRGQQQQARA
jgi:hypothetical protein